jgi:outer membrane lipoprotein carrier protein
VRVFSILALVCLSAQARELAEVLKGVEQHYNRVASLEVQFEQRYQEQGHAPRVESGSLSLRKPGRMRWQYSVPAGKLFVSDGKWVWLYSPSANTAERTRLKETEDFRAPLAFLLGKLDFQRDFGDFELRASGQDSTVIALPRNDKLPYTKVEFTVTPGNAIRRLVVDGIDASRMEFVFTGEKVNPPLPDSMFRYTPPRGVEIIEVER